VRPLEEDTFVDALLIDGDLGPSLGPEGMMSWAGTRSDAIVLRLMMSEMSWNNSEIWKVGKGEEDD
jgi:hypothetical protein